MAVNKNFVVKNGLEVNTDLLFADSATRAVGVGSTSPNFDLDVRGGIGATDLRVTGFTTLTKDLQVGASGSAFYVSNTNNLVGVGTSVPAFLMDIRSSVGTGQTALYVKGDMRVTGDINLDDLTIDDLTVTGIATYKPDGSGGSPDSWIDIDYTGNTTTGGGTTVGFGSTAYFVDNAKVVFGAGEDLSIYHNASNSIIDNTTGDLYLKTSGSGDDVYIESVDDIYLNAASKSAIHVFGDGAVDLYHNDTRRFATTHGGVVVAGGSSITGISTVQSTAQNQLNATTGALQVAGGAGFVKNVYVGGAFEVAGIATFNNNVNLLDDDKLQIGTGNDVEIYSDGTDAIYSHGAGGTVKFETNFGVDIGGIGVKAFSYRVASKAAELYYDNALRLTSTRGGIAVSGGSSITGISTILNTTNSSSSTTGALQVTGGAGIQKNLFVGAGASITGITSIYGGSGDYIAYIENPTESGDGLRIRASDHDSERSLLVEDRNGTDLFSVYGAGGIQFNVGIVTASNTTQSSSSTNGAFQIKGGASVSKNLFVGGGAKVGAAFTVGTGIGVTTILDEDDMASNSATALASQQSIKAYVDTTVTAQDLDFQGDSGGAQNVDLDSQTFTISGTSNEIETTGSSQTLTIGLPDDVTITDVLTVSGTTQSSSKDTGTLILQGGAGIEKNLFVGGGAEITGVTTISNTLDANGAADFASDVDIDDTTQNQLNATTGALKVDGGVGIAKNLYVGGGAEIAGISTFDSNVYLQKADAANLYVGSTNAGGAALFLDGDSNGDWSGSDYSIIRHDSDGNLVLTANSPGAANCYIKLGASGHYGAMFKEGAESLLRYNNTTRIQTGPAGVIVTGVSTADGFSVGDSEYISVGAGGTGDMLLYHNGTNSVIDNSTGNFEILANEFRVKSKTGGEAHIQSSDEGGVNLYWDNNIRFATTDDGADVSGTGSLKIPVGTTAQRSSSPTDGDFRFNSTLNTFEGYSNSNWGEIGGGGGISTSYQNISSTSATGIATFSATAFRSASIILSVTQGTSYQAGRYMVIHDGTTPTVVEESAVATGSMIASFDATIGSGNLTFRATMGSSGIATVGIKVDTLRSDSIP